MSNIIRVTFRAWDIDRPTYSVIYKTGTTKFYSAHNIPEPVKKFIKNGTNDFSLIDPVSGRTKYAVYI